MVCGVPDTCQGQNASVLSVPRLGPIYTCNPLPRSNENFAHSGALPRLRTLIRRLAAKPSVAPAMREDVLNGNSPETHAPLQTKVGLLLATQGRGL